MKINKYNITLTRLKETDIELVRQKRNSDSISANMHFREEITPEMQKNWFNSINNIYNNYFIISEGDRKIGLINGKNIDFKNRTSEGGMFIWDKDFLGTTHAARASIIMSDFNFIINEFEKNYIKILCSNEKAISYNRLLGYRPSNDFRADKEVQWYELTKGDYLKHIPKIRKGIEAQKEENVLSVNDFNFKDDTVEELKKLYEPLPAYLKEKINYCLLRDGQPTLKSE
ncbi:MAG: hypothetical protein K0Q95_2560 [Bacteroidota bacterium]|jgi:RimJ/RimL family protein N-acetyltransferase|nr:hypothetical protein [Bacteroidota bacterium]